MHGEHAIEDLGGNEIVVRANELYADNGRLKPGDYEKDQGVEDVQNSQPLVIDRGHPLMQCFNPRPTCGFNGLNGYCIRRHSWPSLSFSTAAFLDSARARRDRSRLVSWPASTIRS